CPQPTGACCVASGTCTVDTQANCNAAGGTYQGDGTVCTPNPCPQPTGACCVASGTCTVDTQANCNAAGGAYMGDNTACTPGLCPQPCNLPGDLNGNGLVQGDDIGGYIRAKLGQPPAGGENPACADFGTGTLNGDTALFVQRLLM
ncbi:MAG: hypothetical protein ACE5F9_08980, partial [Phycisphaerae bacterium]